MYTTRVAPGRPGHQQLEDLVVRDLARWSRSIIITTSTTISSV